MAHITITEKSLYSSTCSAGLEYTHHLKMMVVYNLVKITVYALVRIMSVHDNICIKINTVTLTQYYYCHTHLYIVYVNYAKGKVSDRVYTNLL